MELEQMLDQALVEGAIAGEALCLVPRETVVALRDKLRAERYACECADTFLSKKQRLLFEALWAHRGQIVSRQQLMAAASLPSYSTLTVHIRGIRRKLALRLPHLEIEPRPGEGYVLREVKR